MTIPKEELSKFSLRGSVTESAANTYTEATINTNLQVEGNMIFIATGLWLGTDATLSAAADRLGFQICYAPQAALVNQDNPDWIAGRSIAFEVVTSGASNWERFTYVNIDNFPLAQSQLFFGAAGTSLAAASTCTFKLEGWLKKVSTTDFFRIARVR